MCISNHGNNFLSYTLPVTFCQSPQSAAIRRRRPKRRWRRSSKHCTCIFYWMSTQKKVRVAYHCKTLQWPRRHDTGGNPRDRLSIRTMTSPCRCNEHVTANMADRRSCQTSDVLCCFGWEWRRWQSPVDGRWRQPSASPKHHRRSHPTGRLLGELQHGLRRLSGFRQDGHWMILQC